MTPDARDVRLRTAFLTELDEHAQGLEDDLLALEEEPASDTALRSAFRRFHTIKGAAAAAGFGPLSTFCHHREEMLAEARRTGQLEPQALQDLFIARDRLSAACKVLRSSDGSDPEEVRLLRNVLGGGPVAAPARKAPARDVDGGDTQPSRRERSAGPETLRVSAARLQEALRAATRVETAARQAIEAGGTGEGHRIRRALTRQVGELMDRVHELRLRPMADAYEPLPRAVRDAARTSAKKVELILEGEAVQAERTVTSALRDALVPLVRNAVAHGIESPKERQLRSKPLQGRIVVSSAIEEGRLVLRVRDDGRGVDRDALAEQLPAGSGTLPSSSEELAQLLLGSNLSARAEADEVSGRGVGLDIVQASLAKVGGAVELSWVDGQGTEVTLRCPASLTTRRVVFCRCGGQDIAFPAISIRRAIRLASDQLRTLNGRTVLPADDGGPPLTVHALASLLGPEFGSGDLRDGAPGLIVEGSQHTRETVLGVDEVSREEETVVRPLPHHIGRGGPASGVALLPSGRLALVLDPGHLAFLAAKAPPPRLRQKVGPEEKGGPPRVLVVDDSITTRTLERSLLEQAGYEVVTASDGARAWEIVRKEQVDLVVSDVDMPGMDGFDLCRAVRASHRLRELPIILVTSLEREEDRLKGLEAGADVYLGKSRFDQERLLDSIRGLLP